MNFDFFFKKDIWIAPSSFHMDFYKEKAKRPTYDGKIYTKEEILSSYYFRLDEKAVFSAMKYFSCSYENAKMYLRELYPLKDLNQEKSTKLLAFVKHLKEEHLLIPNPYFEVQMKGKSIGVIGYEQDRELQAICSYEEFPLEAGENRPSVFSFDDVQKEIAYVYNDICEKIKRGTPKEKIIVIIQDSTIQKEWNRVGKSIGFGESFPKESCWFEIPKYLFIFKEIEQLGISSFLAKEEKSEEEKNIQAWIEKYELTSLPEKRAIETIRSLLKEQKEKIVMPHAITGRSDLPLPREDIYYYILGCYQGVYPSIQKNIGYFLDEEKEKLGRTPSYLLNQNAKKKVLYFLTNAKHLCVSYTTSLSGNTMHPSSLIRELGLVEMKNPVQNHIYLSSSARYIADDAYDLKRKYGESSPIAEGYFALFPKENYHVGNFESFSFPIEEHRKYSYSKIKKYFQCPFLYYLSEVLKLDPFSNSYASIFGSISHAVLKRFYEPNFSFSEVYEEEKMAALATASTQGYVASPEDLFFLSKNKKELEKVIDILKYYHEHQPIAKVHCEAHLECSLSPTITLQGNIDKIMITESEKYIVVDYKSGSERFEKELLPYGYSMQLPTYAYLMKKSGKFQGKIIGLFIEPLMISSLEQSNDLSFTMKKLKWDGIFSDHMEDLYEMDHCYQDSHFISGLATDKEGNLKKYALPHLFSEEELENMLQLVEKLYLQADEEIQKGKFSISPQKVGKENPCEYCPFGDICYHHVEESEEE